MPHLAAHLSSRITGFPLISPFLLFGSLVFFVAWSCDGVMSWGGDNALYLMHAYNLLTNHAYAATGYVQNPWAYLSPQSYPPGLPLLIAWVWSWTGFDVLAFQYALGAVFCLAVVAFAGLTHRDLVTARGHAILWSALIACVGFNPVLVSIGTDILSDGLFLACVCCGLWALESAYRRQDARRTRLLLAALGGIAIGYGLSTRVFGWMLLAAIPAFEMLRFRRPTNTGVTAVITALVVYAAMDAVTMLSALDAPTGGRAASGEGYGALFIAGLWAHLGTLPGRVLGAIMAYASGAGSYLVLEWPVGPAAQEPGIWRYGLTAIALLAGLHGFVHNVRRQLQLRDVFCVLYLLALLPWGAHTARYLLPVIPFFFFYMCISLHALVGYLPSRIATCASLVLVLVLGGVYAGQYHRQFEHEASLRSFAPNSPVARSLFTYIRRQTPADALIVFRKPRVVSLFTGRYAVTLTDSANPVPNDSRVLDYMNRIDADYLLQSRRLDGDALSGLLARHAPRFRPVYRNPQFILYQYRPELALAIP